MQVRYNKHISKYLELGIFGFKMLKFLGCAFFYFTSFQ